MNNLYNRIGLATIGITFLTLPYILITKGIIFAIFPAITSLVIVMTFFTIPEFVSGE